MVEALEENPDWYFNDQYKEEISDEEFAQDPFGQDWIEETETIYPVITCERPMSPKPYDKKEHKKTHKKKKSRSGSSHWNPDSLFPGK